MKNTAMHKCYYLVQPTNMRQKLNIELFCKFGKVKVTVPSPPPPPAYYTRAFLIQGGGGVQRAAGQTRLCQKIKKSENKARSMPVRHITSRMHVPTQTHDENRKQEQSK